jgi:hypothetical protein
VNAICTFSVGSDGYYTLTKVATGSLGSDGAYDITGVTITNGTPTIAAYVVGTTTTAYIDTVQDAIYTGYTNVPTQTANLHAAAYVQNGMASAVFIQSSAATANSTEKLFVFNNTSYSTSIDSSGNTVYLYKAVVNGVIGTVKAASATVFVDKNTASTSTNPAITGQPAQRKGVYNTIMLDSNGYIKSAILVASFNTLAPATAYSSGTLPGYNAVGAPVLAPLNATVNATDNASFVTLSAPMNGFQTWILNSNTIYVQISDSNKTAALVSASILNINNKSAFVYCENTGSASSAADAMTASVVYIVTA